MGDERRFPLLWSRDERGPMNVPWSLVAPHEAQAMRNHGGQTLARLADRGGLCARELYYVLRDEPWPWGGDVVPIADAVAFIEQAAHPTPTRE